MTDQQHPVSAPASHTKQTILTLSMSSDDAEKVLSLFATGGLKELGVLDVTVVPVSTPLARKQWATVETQRDNVNNDDRLPPRR